MRVHWCADKSFRFFGLLGCAELNSTVDCFAFDLLNSFLGEMLWMFQAKWGNDFPYCIYPFMFRKRAIFETMIPSQLCTNQVSRLFGISSSLVIQQHHPFFPESGGKPWTPSDLPTSCSQASIPSSARNSAKPIWLRRSGCRNGKCTEELPCHLSQEWSAHCGWAGWANKDWESIGF